MRAIGIMTGTSLDGIDVGLIETDGYRDIKYLDSHYEPFPESMSDKIKDLINGRFNIKQYRSIEKEYTEYCYDAASVLLSRYSVDVIGFHGQTLYHSPADMITHQMGYAKYLEKLSGIEVIYDFRTDDILQGREGAPHVPLFHKAAVQDQTPFAIINIGGVSNITYIGDAASNAHDIINCTISHKMQASKNLQSQNIIAFDMGPGCAPINDIMYKNYGLKYDENGANARSGKPDMELVQKLLVDQYFSKAPPKSLDRDYFNYDILKGLQPQDQLATVTYFVAYSIKDAFKFLPTQPKVTYLCGGGRNNTFLSELLQNMFHVKHIDSLGFDGDMIEAYAFAYLAVRKKMGLYCGTIV